MVLCNYYPVSQKKLVHIMFTSKLEMNIYSIAHLFEVDCLEEDDEPDGLFK